jgi:hypothetical protein
MAKNYTVKQGECASSIAFENGFFVETIWNHPNNAALKQQRKDPNTLCAGDVVFIPDKREKVVNKQTELVHRFELKNTPALLSLQMFDEDDYRSNQSYEIEIDGVVRTGTTDSEGVLRESILPNARRGKLIIGPDLAVFDLQFGQVEPPTEIRGIQARLNNLGFDCAISGKLDKETKRALSRFQRACEIEETGEIDDATRQKLDDLHDNICDIPNRDEVKAQADSSADGETESEVNDSE